MKHSAGSYISDLKVMQSNAGYYVGRDYTENSFPGNEDALFTRIRLFRHLRTGA